MVTRATITVQLVQWGKTELTVRAIRSVMNSEVDADLELLVYDNGSDGGPGPVASMEGVRLIQGTENIGFGPAHNVLGQLGQGDFLLILNNDTVLAPTALQRLLDCMSDDEVAVAAPQYRDFAGDILEMGGYLQSDAGGWQMFHHMRPPQSFLRMPFPAMYASAACLLVRAGSFHELGGFDDLYAPAYYEDVDLCFKLAERGEQVTVEPRAVVFHYEGGTSGKDVSAGPKAYQTRNRLRFAERWSSRLDGLPDLSRASIFNWIFTPPPGRSRVLVVAPQLPKPDRDAGSVRLLEMLLALTDVGHSVGYWAEHATDFERYAPALEALGVRWFGRWQRRRWQPDNDTGEMLVNVQDVLASVEWDAVILAWPSIAERFAPVARQHRPDAHIFVDAVDLHFLREERAAEVGASHNRSMTAERELEVYANANAVITASPIETKILAERLNGVEVTDFVCVAGVTPAPPPELGRAERLLFLGNFAHPPNMDAVEYWVDDLADRVADLVGREIPLRVVGSGAETLSAEFLERARGRLEIAGWVPDLEDEFAMTRVFVAPLRYGAGTKGKILTAVAHGVPSVTTTIGAEGNSEAVTNILSIADSSEELAAAIAELLTQDTLWLETVDKVQKVAKRFSVDEATQRARFATWFTNQLATKREVHEPAGH